MRRALVTGATGFIAGHCIAELLAHGWCVRGTVRSLANEEKLAHLRAMGSALELVEADLGDDAGWAEAVAGCEGVLHTASPLPMGTPDGPETLIRPAVEGTRRVLRACAGTDVRRVVVTSSVATVLGHEDPDHVHTEEDWAEPSSAYARSKLLAERAAWDLVAGLPESERFELVTLLPSLVLGPLQTDRVNTSIEPLRRLLSGAYPAVPKLSWGVVDVRDVAFAHRQALERPVAAGERYILAGEALWMQEMAKILAEEMGPEGYRVPTRAMPYWVLWLVARFDSAVRGVLPDWGSRKRTSAAKAQRDLGFEARPARESVVITARSLAERGLVEG